MISKRLLSLISRIALLLVALGVAPLTASAVTVTNQDVIKLLEAGASDELIIEMIARGEPKFDTSADAIVLLKGKGASDKLLAAILMSSSGGAGAAPSAPAAPAAPPTFGAPGKSFVDGGSWTGEVVLIEDGKRVQLFEMTADHAMNSGLSLIGRAASYHSLKGLAAKKRTTNSMPEFIVGIPKNNAPEGEYVLTRWEPRPRKGTREILAGHATSFSNSASLPKERVIEVELTRFEEQSAPAGWAILYRLKPKSPLPPGEYVLMKNGGPLCYELGVDGAK